VNKSDADVAAVFLHSTFTFEMIYVHSRNALTHCASARWGTVSLEDA